MIDNYYEIFEAQFCAEIEDDDTGIGGGSMICPNQSVSTNKDHIKKNQYFLEKNHIYIAPAIDNLYAQIGTLWISYRPDIKYFSTQISILPEDFDFISVDHVNIRESICNDRPSLKGSMRILEIEKLINGPDGKKWKDVLWFDHMEEDIKAEWQKYLLFDHSVSECGVLLKLENNRIEDRLYFYYMDNEVPIDLGIGIEQYLMMAYKVKAFNGWQYALAKHPGDNGLTLKRMKHYLPQMFPKLEFDFSDFKEV